VTRPDEEADKELQEILDAMFAPPKKMVRVVEQWALDLLAPDRQRLVWHRKDQGDEPRNGR
jgi:hypothetical protein